MRLEQMLSTVLTGMYLFDVVVVSIAYTNAGYFVLIFTVLYCASIGEIFSISKLGRWLSAKRHHS